MYGYAEGETVIGNALGNGKRALEGMAGIRRGITDRVSREYSFHFEWEGGFLHGACGDGYHLGGDRVKRP